ncbi:MAG TPA: cupin domain-containing protein [Symbiobacteriaceae bacterium]|nr:cupin domain-containing protein [Symbiobacteriaceae bacterium]
MERVNVSEKSVLSAERFTKQICFSHPDVLVFVLTFSPGQALPPHRHPGSAVVLHVSAGTGLAVVDGRESPLAAGDVLLVPGNEELTVRNTGEAALVLLVSLSPNPTNPAYSKEIK